MLQHLAEMAELQGVIEVGGYIGCLQPCRSSLGHRHCRQIWRFSNKQLLRYRTYDTTAVPLAYAGMYRRRSFAKLKNSSFSSWLKIIDEH